MTIQAQEHMRLDKTEHQVLSLENHQNVGRQNVPLVLASMNLCMIKLGVKALATAWVENRNLELMLDLVLDNMSHKAVQQLQVTQCLKIREAAKEEETYQVQATMTRNLSHLVLLILCQIEVLVGHKATNLAQVHTNQAIRRLKTPHHLTSLERSLRITHPQAPQALVLMIYRTIQAHIKVIPWETSIESLEEKRLLDQVPTTWNRKALHQPIQCRLRS